MRTNVIRILFAGMLCACNPPPASTQPALLVARASDAMTLDPARITTAESAEISEQIFDHLVRYRPNSTEIEPSLATKWEVSGDGKVWTFSLRTGVTFHDGTPCDADAVVFSLERQRNVEHPFHEPDFIYWETTYRNILSIEKVDTQTVRITIEKPYAPFLANLAMFPVSIVSPAAVKKWGHEFWKHPVGTGPFRFVEWQPGERITLAAYDKYWEGRAQLEHLAFTVVRDEHQRLAALEAGAVDIAESLSPDDLQFVSLHPELTLHRVAGNNVGYLAMNTQKPPFNDVRVRRAVNYAINKTAIVKLVYQGLARAATTPVPPSLWGSVEEPLYAYRKSEAIRLLEEANYVQPAKRPRLYTMSTPRQYMPAPEQVARIIQHNLHEVGIDIDVVVNDINTHVELTQNGQHDLCLLGWSGDNGDPDNFLYVLLDSSNAEPGTARNLAFYKDPELHGILTWAQESLVQKERENYYKRAQELIARAAPWVPLAYAEVVVAARRSLVGVSVHPSSNIYFYRVRRQ